MERGEKVLPFHCRWECVCTSLNISDFPFPPIYFIDSSRCTDIAGACEAAEQSMELKGHWTSARPLPEQIEKHTYKPNSHKTYSSYYEGFLLSSSLSLSLSSILPQKSKQHTIKKCLLLSRFKSYQLYDFRLPFNSRLLTWTIFPKDSLSLSVLNFFAPTNLPWNQ